MKSIRSDRPFFLPIYVKKALQRLDEAGYVAYVVGGCVRDFLLGKESKDHDIVTNANPDDLCRLFPKVITVGKSFGVIKVPTDQDSTVLEIATFREDLEYEDHRHPQGVIYSGPEEDAKRRDFTINALFFDPKTSRILDFVGGLQDLKEGTIRAIGVPSERFREDALRLLRAIRFKTRLGFCLDPETEEAIRARAKLISKVSAERIREELTLMGIGPRFSESVELLSDLGLLVVVLPEVEALKRDKGVWKHLLKTMEYLEAQNAQRSPALAWAALLHKVENEKNVAKITTRLKMSRSDSDRIFAMIADRSKFREVFQMRESTLQRFIRQEGFEELLALHKAEATATDGNLAHYEFCASRFEEIKKTLANGPEKWLDGNDLIQLGLSPGPEFTEILRTIEDLTLDRKIRSKEEALEYVFKNFIK